MSREPINGATHLTELAAGLVTIEINTIVKSDITGSKMPQVEHALMDIAVSVWQFLIATGAVEQKSDADWNRDVHAGWAAWQACRKAASEARSEAKAPADPGERIEHDVRMGKLERIVRACDQLKGILYDTSKAGGATAGGNESSCGEACRISRDSNGAVEHTHNGAIVIYGQLPATKDRRWMFLDPRQRAVLRKIWEVGLEDIALQTIIQLDGDIVTRVHPRYIENDGLMRIHREAIRASQTVWGELIDIALRLFEAVTKALKA